jgi:(2Fe-2S) ferredoxin
VGKPQKHLFICQNMRDPSNPRGSCKARGSEETLSLLKDEIKKRGIRQTIEFDGSTCVDCCKYGPVMVVYPDNIWLGNITEDKLTTVLDLIQHNGDLSAYQIPDEDIRRS